MVQVSRPTGRWLSQPPYMHAPGCDAPRGPTIGRVQIAHILRRGSLTHRLRAQGYRPENPAAAQRTQHQHHQKQRSANSSRSIMRLACQRRRGHTPCGSCLSRSTGRRDSAAQYGRQWHKAVDARYTLICRREGDAWRVHDVTSRPLPRACKVLYVERI